MLRENEIAYPFPLPLREGDDPPLDGCIPFESPYRGTNPSGGTTVVEQEDKFFKAARLVADLSHRHPAPNVERGPPDTRDQQGERSTEKTTVAESHKDRPGTKTLDYIGLGLLLAPPTVVFEMYMRSDSIDWKKVAIATPVCWIAGGLVVWASHGWQSWKSSDWRIVPYLRAAESRFWVKALIVLAFMGFALALSSFLSTKGSVPSAGNLYTQEQVAAEKAAAVAEAVANLNPQLAEANQQRDVARREVDVLRQKIQNAPPPTPPAPEDQIPVNWQPDFQLNWYAGPKIAWVRFLGVSTALARIREAYVISTLTGHKEPLDLANPTNFTERWKVDQVEPIPSGAAVVLIYEPKPPPSLPDFMSQWGAFEFHVVYNDKEYVKTYSQDYINSKMTREMPGMFGPRVTPRNDK
jgi:hypothetical protein